MVNPQHDPRTVDELVNVALGEMDEDISWNAVCALHWKGSLEVLRRAARRTASECPQERRLGADILGQLGVPERTFSKECSALLLDMIESEENPDVIQSIFVAFSHLHEPRAIRVAEEYAMHPDPDVRHAVVLALTGHEDQRAIDLLIKLMSDSHPYVRDWATFALGTQLDLDMQAIRNALAARLNDEDDETRGEAMVGLARRKDQRVIAAIQRELASEVIGIKAIEAAELCGSPELLPHLITLRQLEGNGPSALDDAIAACTSDFSSRRC